MHLLTDAAASLSSTFGIPKDFARKLVCNYWDEVRIPETSKTDSYTCTYYLDSYKQPSAMAEAMRAEGFVEAADALDAVLVARRIQAL